MARSELHCKELFLKLHVEKELQWESAVQQFSSYSGTFSNVVKKLKYYFSQIMTYTNSAKQAILVFGFIAKFLSAFYWPFIETYNSEINPTVIRDSVAGLTRYNIILWSNWHHQSITYGEFSSIAGLGGVMTPSLMVFEYHPPTISIISILITNLLCLLPTTLNHNLPETFEEAAAIQDRVNMFIEQRRKRSSKVGGFKH